MPNDVEKVKKALKTNPISEKNITNEEEMVKVDDLKRGLVDLKSRNNAVESKSIISKNEIETLRVDLIKDLLGKLSDLGVDPGDTSSINNFLKNLEMQDPDLKTLFEDAFNYLLGSEEQSNVDMEPTNNMPEMGAQMPPSNTVV